MPQENPANKHVKNEFLRLTLLCCGWFSLAAGVVGIFLPLVPTIPLLLLAAACFARSSHRFYTWLVEHNHLGPLLRDYLNDGRIPSRSKKMAIGMIWLSVPASAYLFVPVVWVKFLLLAIAAGITIYLLGLPTAPSADKHSEKNGDK